MRWALKPTSTLAPITSANASQRLLRPAPMPAIEMAGFDSSFPARLPVIEMAGFAASSSSKPAVEMAGFGSRKYRLTVSRLIPNSFAIRRCDQPRCAKLYYRYLQAHSQDVRHAPQLSQLRGRPGLFLLLKSGRF